MSLRTVLQLYIASKSFGQAPKSLTAFYDTIEVGVLLFIIPGAWLADTRLGKKGAVLTGSILLVAGQLVFLLNNFLGLYAGAILFALGSGLFRPALLASLFEASGPPTNERTDAVFTANLLVASLVVLLPGMLLPGFVPVYGYLKSLMLPALVFAVAATVGLLLWPKVKGEPLPKPNVVRLFRKQWGALLVLVALGGLLIAATGSINALISNFLAEASRYMGLPLLGSLASKMAFGASVAAALAIIVWALVSAKRRAVQHQLKKVRLAAGAVATSFVLLVVFWAIPNTNLAQVFVSAFVVVTVALAIVMVWAKPALLSLAANDGAQPQTQLSTLWFGFYLFGAWFIGLMGQRLLAAAYLTTYKIPLFAGLALVIAALAWLLPKARR